MTLHSSATEFIKYKNTHCPTYCSRRNICQKWVSVSRMLHWKKVNFYVFEDKEGSYITNGVDKKWKVCDIVILSRKFL